MSSKNLGTSLVDDDENEELLVIDDELTLEKLSVLQKALQSFTSRFSPMNIKNDSVRLFNFQKRVARKLLRAFKTMMKAPIPLIVSAMEAQVLKEALHQFVSSPTSVGVWSATPNHVNTNNLDEETQKKIAMELAREIEEHLES